VYAKALCLLLKALGGCEKSRLDFRGGSESGRFATPGTRNDVPLPSHTLVVALAIGRLRRRWRPETDLTRCRWDAVLAGWHLSTVPVSLSFWNNLLMLRFVHPLSGNSASNLLGLYPFDRCKLLINILSSSLNVIVYKYCSDVWIT